MEFGIKIQVATTIKLVGRDYSHYFFTFLPAILVKIWDWETILTCFLIEIHSLRQRQIVSQAKK